MTKRNIQSSAMIGHRRHNAGAYHNRTPSCQSAAPRKCTFIVDFQGSPCQNYLVRHIFHRIDFNGTYFCEKRSNAQLNSLETSHNAIKLLTLKGLTTPLSTREQRTKNLSVATHVANCHPDSICRHKQSRGALLRTSHGMVRSMQLDSLTKHHRQLSQY